MQFNQKQIDKETSSSLVERRSRSEFLGKSLFVVCAIVVLSVVMDYIMANRRVSVDGKYSGLISDGQYVQFGGDGAHQLLENPNLSWAQKNFCTGYKKSSACSNKPLHPLYQYYVEEKLKNVSAEDLRTKYGLNPQETKTPGKISEQAHLKSKLLEGPSEGSQTNSYGSGQQ